MYAVSNHSHLSIPPVWSHAALSTRLIIYTSKGIAFIFTCARVVSLHFSAVPDGTVKHCIYNGDDIVAFIVNCRGLLVT